MCTTFTGPHCCAEADLVVVPDLSMLHDVDVLAGSLDLTICLLSIVALGLDITTQRHLDAAGGVPRPSGVDGRPTGRQTADARWCEIATIAAVSSSKNNSSSSSSSSSDSNQLPQGSVQCHQRGCQVPPLGGVKCHEGVSSATSRDVKRHQLGAKCHEGGAKCHEGASSATRRDVNCHRWGVKRHEGGVKCHKGVSSATSRDVKCHRWGCQVPRGWCQVPPMGCQVPQVGSVRCHT